MLYVLLSKFPFDSKNKLCMNVGWNADIVFIVSSFIKLYILISPFRRPKATNSSFNILIQQT